MQREFIGGRVPKMVKDAFVAEADRAGLTLTDHLEKILTERMNGKLDEADSSPVSREDVRELIRQELSETGSLAEDEDQDEYLPEDLDHCNEEFDTDAIDELLDCPAGDYIQYAVWSTWDQNDNEWLYKDLDQEALIDFLEMVSTELQFLAEVPPAIGEEVDIYREYLPDPFIRLLDEQICWVAVDLEDRRPPAEVLPKLASRMDHQADILFQESRAIELMFTRQEYYQLDRMLEKLNNDRWSDHHFKDLKSLILHCLGGKLQETGTGFWGVTDRGMVELGERWKKVAGQ